jgi:hypothetical protein
MGQLGRKWRRARLVLRKRNETWAKMVRRTGLLQDKSKKYFQSFNQNFEFKPKDIIIRPSFWGLFNNEILEFGSNI